uniref:Gamma-tubulin complex component n=1 Tax=Romanomermis culicivorax TaxID=13658 RepID=A0A915IQT3_ROMCU
MIRANHNENVCSSKRVISAATPDIASTSSGVSSNRSGSSKSIAERAKSSNERSSSRIRNNVLTGRNAYDQSSSKVAEDELLRDILFCLQGIDGRYIKLEEKNRKFVFNEMDNITVPTRKILIRIADCGLVYTNIKKLLNQISLNQNRGSISTAFTAAIQNELTEYYRSIAIYKSRVIDFQRSCIQRLDEELTNNSARISVSRMIPLLLRWKDKLILILSILECCKDLVGGKIVSSLFTYANTGDLDMGTLVTGLLESTCKPILMHMCSWMFDGKLEDLSDEFFIAQKDGVVGENAWREKFFVREPMLPSFLDLTLAKKILLAGKSIHFLRLICNERISILPQVEPKRVTLLNLPATCLFDYVQKGELIDIVDNVYQEISKHLIEVLNNEFHMFAHLSALKKYILLSQGDFCRCLLDLLENDLEKPANQVFRHSVVVNLDASLRQTNAQFECKEILDRIKVDFTDFSDDDTGWDIFRLKYLNTGVLSMVLNQQCLSSYNRLFDFIWRLKRVSFVLSNIWRDNSILRKSDCLLS